MVNETITRDMIIMSSLSGLGNALFLCTRIDRQSNVLTNHDKNDLALCHVF